MKTDVEGGVIRHRIGEAGTFVLRSVSGTVRLTGTDTDEVELVARDESGRAAQLAVRRADGLLHVEPERQGRTFFGANIGIGLPDIHFEVELPRGTRVELNSVSADVSAKFLHGDQSYKLVSGDLELADGGGRIDTKSVSGDVALRASGAVELDATTTSGDLLVDGPDLQFVRLRSVSGDATVRGRLSDGPEHRVETVSGDLRLEVTGGLTIEASGPIVGLRSNIEGQVSSDRGRRGLVIGDGAAQLRFRSMSGEVRVEGEFTDREPVTSRAPRASAEPAKPRPAAKRPDAIDVLRAVERGEMDVEEASRLLGEEGDRA